MSFMRVAGVVLVVVGVVTPNAPGAAPPALLTAEQKAKVAERD